MASHGVLGSIAGVWRIGNVDAICAPNTGAQEREVAYLSRYSGQIQCPKVQYLKFMELEASLNFVPVSVPKITHSKEVVLNE